MYKSLCHVWLHGRHFFCAVVLPMWTMSSLKGVQNNHMAAPVKVARQQTTPELSRTFRTLPPEPMHQRTDLPPELPSATCLRNLHQPAPELSGTLHNLPESTPAHTGTLRHLPELASGTYTSTHRNLPEPSGTCLRNLHQHTPELSGTFRNLPSEPAPATRTGTHRSLSGLKTPLAYAVGEISKNYTNIDPKQQQNHVSTTFMRNKQYIGRPLPGKTNEKRGTNPGTPARNQKKPPENKNAKKLGRQATEPDPEPDGNRKWWWNRMPKD